MKKQESPLERWTQKETLKLVGLWMDGIAIDDIAKRLGRTCKAVSKHVTRLRQNGVPLEHRKAGHKTGMTNRLWTQEEVEYVWRRRREKVSAEQIAQELDRSFYAVQGMILKLRQEGVDIGMLGQGVRRLWNPQRLADAVATRNADHETRLTDIINRHKAAVAQQKKAA